MDGEAEHCKQEKSKNKITGITERRERMTERKIAKRKKDWELKHEINTSEERMQREKNEKQKSEKEWHKK